MKNKITLTLLGIVTITIFSLFWAKSIDEDSWICTEVGWIEHGKPSIAKPAVPCTETEKELAVEKYLKEKISVISPSKEVLGGKFYITKIDWLENNSGIVEYEDGHIALKASFNYEIAVNIQNNGYSIIINNFNILN